MDKKFACSALILDNECDVEEAVDVGFAISIAGGAMDSDLVRRRFDALAIGETLTDGDGDTWERIA